MKGSLQADAWARAGGAPGAPQRPRSGKNLLASGCTGELASGHPRPAVSWWGGGGEVRSQRQGRAWGGGPKYQPVPGRGRVCRRGGYHPDDSEGWGQRRRGLEKTGTEREAGRAFLQGEQVMRGRLWSHPSRPIPPPTLGAGAPWGFPTPTPVQRRCLPPPAVTRLKSAPAWRAVGRDGAQGLQGARAGFSQGCFSTPVGTRCPKFEGS